MTNEEENNNIVLVEAFIGNFRYKGELLKEDDLTYYVLDDKSNKVVRLPKGKAVLIYEERRMIEGLDNED